MDYNINSMPHRLYGLNDMVKADCGGCTGCSDCCKGMGTSIVLDPFDVAQMEEHLGKTFEELLLGELELNIVDGIILPNIKMTKKVDCCIFLNGEGRCDIHTFRPGICRLFPLGRQYEEGRLYYFTVQGECTKESHSKVKVKKWLDIPNINQNQEFVTKWHYFKKYLKENIEQETEEGQKNLQLFFLKHFFMKPYSSLSNFYKEFEIRLMEANKIFNIS